MSNLSISSVQSLRYDFSNLDTTEYSHTGNTTWTLKKSFTYTPPANAIIIGWIFEGDVKSSDAGTDSTPSIKINAGSAICAISSSGSVAYVSKSSNIIMVTAGTFPIKDNNSTFAVTIGLLLTGATAQTVYMKNIRVGCLYYVPEEASGNWT